MAATFSELLLRLRNEDINAWLQLGAAAWSQSVLSSHTPISDVVQPPAGVVMTTTRDVLAPAESDDRFLSATTRSGKRSAVLYDVIGL